MIDYVKEKIRTLYKKILNKDCLVKLRLSNFYFYINLKIYYEIIS
ncbi:hypothetical protein CNEO4_550015 [Clostridium neonatale]|uniref:Uncharacterized protein n=1 Tax=Clostridium neonatale TaxID=137838 RepID=A0AA86JRT9_9CLOT|nr:hypothetical protein CNEO_44268 [Clostridium neonatale]CAG9717093.1 hypothetical protein CNEO_450003 [Clostridium neonatale]CAI3193488.1 hypothetical protein CNEO2_110014 [Clostridium neonatale]CAI3208962.1 hypothetical protein CNEO2_60061 [Clostridium neonatale]CAI3211497.1 hypothetical protein CNEO2_520014 [Clostridium neonatale]